VIRRRSSQQKGKDTPRDGGAPAAFFNFTDDPGPAEESPLFNLEELHERRILSWSPEPDEFFEHGDQAQAEPEPTRHEREELARSVYERPAAVEERVEVAPQATVVSAPPLERVPPPPAARVVTRPLVPVAKPVAEPVRDVAPPAALEDEVEEATPVVRSAPKRRGRPRGRPRRQVHFHVDPDEERLLMAAVERYGSQQKGLIAALESLQEADLLRDEIERLRAETARQRKLLEEAESLFNR
jgi:uncharacterized small protein (DUF1192 family)